MNRTSNLPVTKALGVLGGISLSPEIQDEIERTGGNIPSIEWQWFLNKNVMCLGDL